MSAQPMERALQKEVRELREALVAAEAVVKAARNLRWFKNEDGEIRLSYQKADELLAALAVFDGLARSGTDV